MIYIQIGIINFMLVYASFLTHSEYHYLKMDIKIGSEYLAIEQGVYNYDLSYKHSLSFLELDSVGNCKFSIYENGKIAMTGYYYSDGLLQTMQIMIESLEDNGEPPIMVQGTFYDLKRDSIWNYFSPDGSIVRSEKYVRGTLRAVSSFSEFPK